MKDIKSDVALLDSQKQTYEFVKKSWELEGYNFTKEDENTLINLLKNKTTADEEVNKILKKQKKGSDNNA